MKAYLAVAPSKLTRLKLTFGQYEARPESLDLVLSVGAASSGPHALQCLALHFSTDEDSIREKAFPPLELSPVAAVFHRLTSLRHLSLGCAPSDAFYGVISPQTLPNLVKLKVRDPGVGQR